MATHRPSLARVAPHRRQNRTWTGCIVCKAMFRTREHFRYAMRPRHGVRNKHKTPAGQHALSFGTSSTDPFPPSHHQHDHSQACSHTRPPNSTALSHTCLLPPTLPCVYKMRGCMLSLSISSPFGPARCATSPSVYVISIARPAAPILAVAAGHRCHRHRPCSHAHPHTLRVCCY